ncbi:hypothetical protein OFC38_31895, partial [Escherichia coli]|nr:hypothetical protein [Escherichia coli]
FERRAESGILTDAAPYLSDFVSRLFRIESDRKELQNDILVQNPVWKYKFFVQRRAIKRYKTPEDLAGVNRQEIDEAIRELRFKAFDDTL